MNAPSRQARSPAPADRPLTDVATLVESGLIEPGAAERAAEAFAVRIPPAFLGRLRPGGAIARQVLPAADELVLVPEDRLDPIGDQRFSPLPGLVHRHPDRVLLKPTLACPVHCRFCFRRHEVGSAGALAPEDLAAALAYIRDHAEVREVILTGGDPLMLSPRRLKALARDLAAIPHLRVLRVHSRVPVAAPERITGEAVAALAGTRLPVFLVVHCNHADELGPKADAALARLVDAGLPVLSQTVLLKGVNDDDDVLAALFEALVERRVRPYYLHHGDLVPGAAHFRTSLEDGRALMAALRRRLSGLALPTYILDIPGGHGKVPAEGAHVDPDDGIVFDGSGNRHPYPIAKPGDTC